MKSLSKRNWTVVFWFMIEPARGKWKGLQIARRHTRGRLTAAQAWRVFTVYRHRAARIELWHGRNRILPSK